MFNLTRFFHKLSLFTFLIVSPLAHATFLGDPTHVQHGGTGAATLTQDQIVIGNGTSAVNTLGGTNSIPYFSALSVPTTLSVGSNGVVGSLPTGEVTSVLGVTNEVLVWDAAGALASSFLTNVNIDAAAAIARTKLASGTADHVIINNGSGVMSSEAQLGVPRGGTGAATLPLNNVILGNGTSAVQSVAPGTTGNVLTSDGTTWTSAAAPASGGVSVVLVDNAASPYTVVFGSSQGVQVRCDATAGNVNILVPATIAGNVGKTVDVKRLDNSGNTCTVTADTTGTPDLIDGAATRLVTLQYDNLSIRSAGTANAWDVL